MKSGRGRWSAHLTTNCWVRLIFAVITLAQVHTPKGQCCIQENISEYSLHNLQRTSKSASDLFLFACHHLGCFVMTSKCFPFSGLCRGTVHVAAGMLVALFWCCDILRFPAPTFVLWEPLFRNASSSEVLNIKNLLEIFKCRALELLMSFLVTTWGSI